MTESRTEASENPNDGGRIASELQLRTETVENRTNSLDENRVAEYQQILNEKNILAKKALDLGVWLKERADSFATGHGWNSSIKNALIKGLEKIGIGVAIGSAAAIAAEAGILAGAFAGAGIFVAGEVSARVTDFGVETAVTYAISQASNEKEAQAYADLVISMAEWGMIGLSAVGAYKGIRGKIPTLRNTFSKAKISELFKIANSKKAATVSVVEARTSTSLGVNDVGIISDEFAGYGLPWLSWRQYPKVVLDGTTYAKIGDRLYTEHAVGRMLPSGLGRNASCTKIGTSMSPNFVEEVIRKGGKVVEMRVKQGKQIEEWVFTLGDCKVCNSK